LELGLFGEEGVEAALHFFEADPAARAFAFAVASLAPT
jgi:hypothetical protein